MLNSIRKFSGTPYSKILLAIVILPFVMWGMGDVFRGGKKNVIAEINSKKILTQDFLNFINQNLTQPNFDENIFEDLLSKFLSRKLIDIESENFKIKISDHSLIKILKNNDAFKEENIFSRTKYEKFLISNNLTAVLFEKKLREEESRRQLISLISGGVKPPFFLINREYDSKNQIRNIMVINLNDLYSKEMKFSDAEIEKYYNENLDKFTEQFNSIEYSTITPEMLTGQSEYNNLFFEKIDRIEDEIASEIAYDKIIKKFNLLSHSSNFFNIKGKTSNNETLEIFSKEIIKKIFGMKINDPITLINHKDNYFLIKLNENKNIYKKLNQKEVKMEIISILKNKKITDKNSKLIESIVKNEFNKNSFDKLASKNNLNIEKIKLQNINDAKKINKTFITNIYQLPKNKLYVFSNENMNENLLVYIDKIENVSIDNNKDEYKNYLTQTNLKIVNNIHNSYDSYINNKYKIDINHKSIEQVKNYFR